MSWAGRISVAIACAMLLGLPSSAGAVHSKFQFVPTIVPNAYPWDVPADVSVSSDGSVLTFHTNVGLVPQDTDG